MDFGAATMLVKNKFGQDLLIAGQKSAQVHAINPDSSETVWSSRFGRGGIIGGVHWGMAVNPKLGLIFAPNSDKKVFDFPAPGVPAPGLYALDVNDGAQRWHYSRDSRCEEQECIFGLSAAVIAANDVVVSGSMDGFLEVIHAESGQLLWSYDAWRDFATVKRRCRPFAAPHKHNPH